MIKKLLLILLPLLLIAVSDVSAGSSVRSGGSSSKVNISKPSTPKVSSPAPKVSTPAPKISTPKVTTPAPTTPKKSYGGSGSTGSSSNTALTLLGMYLILDSFDDDGDPIYIDRDTGQQYTEDQVEEMQEQEQGYTDPAPAPEPSVGMSALTTFLDSSVLNFLLMFMAIAVVPILMGTIRRMF